MWIVLRPILAFIIRKGLSYVKFFLFAGASCLP